jgi:transcriptional regulator with XRE-family HTH domain
MLTMNKKTIFKNDYLQLIDVISAERKRLGLSQAEVAKLLNMSQSDISKIESNERRLDIYELKLLLQIFRIHTNETLQTKILEYFGFSKEIDDSK